MYILDTDHLSILERDTVESFNFGRWLATIPSAEVFTTIVTYEEKVRGWLTYAARALLWPHK